jgi:copper chaperone CopZ
MGLYTDIDAAIAAAPTATGAQTTSMSPDGPIMDLDGNLKLVKLKFQEADVLLKEIVKTIDAEDSSNDTLAAAIDSVQGAF